MAEDVLYGPMLSERFADRFVGFLDMIEDHHTVHGSTGPAASRPTTPARTLSATRMLASSATRRSSAA
jgi:hypothetical protein